MVTRDAIFNADVNVMFMTSITHSSTRPCTTLTLIYSPCQGSIQTFLSEKKIRGESERSDANPQKHRLNALKEFATAMEHPHVHRSIPWKWISILETWMHVMHRQIRHIRSTRVFLRMRACLLAHPFSKSNFHPIKMDSTA